LPPGQKEAFAAGFVDLTLQLGSRADEMMASRQALPAELPDPLTQPNVKYKANRRRAYTGREAAEEEEKNRRRAARKANREAELQRAENEAWNTELVQEARDRVKARDVLVVHAPAIVAQQRQQLAPPTLPTPSNVIEISSDEDKTESVDYAAETQDIIKVEPIQDIGALVDAGEGECTSSTESEDVGRGRDYIENSDDDEVDITPSILIAPTVLTRDISSITTLTAQHKRQKKQKKHWSQILPPSSIQSRSSRKPTARFESQNARDIAAAEMKEQRRKEREAKVNRTGTGRTKKAEHLAETSQLLDGLEFPFRSSQ
jgi:hypothetical protein